MPLYVRVEGEAVGGGIGWILEPYLIDCVTFVRGVEPAELAARLGARPGQEARRGSAEDAAGLLAGGGAATVARVGRVGEWSFAVEYGDAVGSTGSGLGAVSSEGADAVNFLLTPWHPPSMFAYFRDGVRVCSFGLGEEGRRWGERPDLLVPALTETGVLPVRPELRKADAERSRRLSVLTVGDHFGLRLPRADVLDGELPLFVVRTA
ncbi:DUF6461 domain-containing protein [Streptomyces sp. NBC_01476]|uniref:DUF6461 domain-containing protein n=1 Tax=Streptomyces sp. NBC_01476 TaxID=2903881 RepID=UPI002E330009|nr:DUF6461 domain-containing protein [Streptomyces sp. NBC_01476]